MALSAAARLQMVPARVWQAALLAGSLPGYNRPMNTLPTPESRLAALGVDLPRLFPPAGTYVNAVRSGSLVFLAGHIPYHPDGSVAFGKLGLDVDVETGYAAARGAALAMLVTIRETLGTLDLVGRIVRVSGLVNAAPDFTQHTRVIDGASDVLVEVFGEAGRHARLAVGVSSLPANICLEVDAIVEVKDGDATARRA